MDHWGGNMSLAALESFVDTLVSPGFVSTSDEHRLSSTTVDIVHLEYFYDLFGLNITMYPSWGIGQNW